MKRKTVLIFEICKIFVNFLFVPLYFIKIYHSVAALPGIGADEETVVIRKDCFYSVYDKFARENFLPLLFVSFALILVSVTVSVCASAIKDNKKLTVASHVLFGISAVFFLSLLLIGACIIYCY